MSTDLSAPLSKHFVRINDDAATFHCASDDTLLRAALRAGVGIPYECGSGGCGACRVQLVEGEIEDVWDQAPGLTPRLRERGFRLACQTRPLTGCHVKIRTPLRDAAAHLPARRPARLVERIVLTEDMTEFCFQAEGRADFAPGQFALVSLPGVTGDRAYSMSNLPNADGLWKFVVKRMPNGSGSSALFDRLTLGDEVVVDGPYGMSYLRHESPRNIVCIAGGSGLSPVLSILGAASRQELGSRSLTLFYGGKRPSDLCVPSVIDRDPSMRGRVNCIAAISDKDFADPWDGERGFIHEVVGRRLQSSGQDPLANDYYFCGPPPMTDAVQRLLLELRVPMTQSFYDRFV